MTLALDGQRTTLRSRVLDPLQVNLQGDQAASTSTGTSGSSQTSSSPTARHIPQRTSNEALARFNASSGASMLAHRLQSSSSLLTEDIKDGRANCLDQANAYVAGLSADEQRNAELVFLRDNRGGAEGASGHVVVKNGEQIVDPATGKKYASTAEYLAQNPQYSEAGRVSAEQAKTILDKPPGSPERQRALDEAKVPPALQQMMVADDDTKIMAPGDPKTVAATAEAQRKAREAAQYDYYKQMIERNGGTFDSTPNQRNMLAIRNDTSTKANDGKNEYDDKAVLLWIDDKGEKHVTSYDACTEPGEAMLDGHGEAIGGDDRNDLGRLPAGSYTYHLRHSTGREALGLIKRGPFDNEGTRQILGAPTGAKWEAEYDIDHDGDFDENVKGKDGQEILWHMGRNDDHPGSAGCQSMRPDDWRRFLHDLDLKENESLNYTLVQASSENKVWTEPDPNSVMV